MSVDLAVAAAPAVAPRDSATAWRRDRRFFTAMSVAIALTVFAGFAPTYYLKTAFGRPALSPFLHLHGLLFSTWIAFFVLQVRLVAVRRVALHRRLGVFGGVLAAAMIVVGLTAAIASARRGFTPPGGPASLVFLIIPVGDLILFASLVGTGLYFRRWAETHRRLMLLATIGLLPPAIARLPHIGAAGPMGFFGVADLFLIACLLYDGISRRRVHPAFVWGGLAIVLSQVLRLMIGGTHAWLEVATWLTR